MAVQMGLVLDASVIIALSQLDLLRNLLRLQVEVVATKDVLREVTLQRVKRMLASKGLKIVDSKKGLVPPEFRLGLGDGKLSVLAFCLQNRNLWAILDDLPARQVAKTLGLKYCGTARLLRFMAEKGAIEKSSLRNILLRLSAHLWIDASTIETVLTESPPDLSG